MSHDIVTQEEFELDVANHVLTIEHEVGLFRSLMFQKPGSGNMHFRITTWPGHLCFSGDMGTYVFSRVQDMFEFFRGEKINPSYWSEKVVASAPSGNGVMEYNPDLMRQRLDEWMDDWDVPEEILPGVKKEVMEHLEYDLDSEDATRRALYEFDQRDLDFTDVDEGDLLNGLNMDFNDFGEISTRTFTYHYIWCCRALVWAVAQYDAKKKAGPNVRAAS